MKGGEKELMHLLKSHQCGAFMAVVGATLCFLQAGGVALPCVSSSCQLYQGYEIGGIPVDVIGGLGFILLFLLHLGRYFNRELIPFWSLIVFGGIVFDAGLLGYQILYWRCTVCLIVALFFGLSVVPFAKSKEHDSVMLARAMKVWAAMLVVVCVLFAKDSLLTPVSLSGGTGSELQVFFSPTCPTCQTVVNDLLDRYSDLERITLIPVAKNHEDEERLAKVMGNGDLEADDIRALFNKSLEEVHDLTWRERFSLAKNKMIVASLGARSVPLVVTQKVVADRQITQFPWQQQSQSSSLQEETLEGCGFSGHDCTEFPL